MLRARLSSSSGSGRRRSSPRSGARRSATGERSEKIRTYNYPGEPRHRPPDQADRAPARPRARGRARRAHRGARGGGAAARARDRRARVTRARGGSRDRGASSPRRACPTRASTPSSSSRTSSASTRSALDGTPLRPADVERLARARRPAGRPRAAPVRARRVGLPAARRSRSIARALIPRPETEMLVERCLALARGRRRAARPRRRDRLGRDRARARRRAPGRAGRRRRRVPTTRSRSRGRTPSGPASPTASTFAAGDLLDGDRRAPFDLVVSNPPYVGRGRARRAPARDPRLGAARRRSSRTARRRRSRRPRATCSAPGGALVLEVADGAAGGVAGPARRARLRGRARHARPRGDRARRRGARVTERRGRRRRRCAPGKPVVLPTDTVYGLCADAYREEPARRLAGSRAGPRGCPSRSSPPISRRSSTASPSFAAAPRSWRGRSSRGRTRSSCRTRRDASAGSRARARTRSASAFPSCPSRPGPSSSGSARSRRRARTSTAAPDPRRLEDIPEEIRAAAAAIVDAGELPGTPSTVST